MKKKKTHALTHSLGVCVCFARVVQNIFKPQSLIKSQYEENISTYSNKDCGMWMKLRMVREQQQQCQQHKTIRFCIFYDYVASHSLSLTTSLWYCTVLCTSTCIGVSVSTNVNVCVFMFICLFVYLPLACVCVCVCLWRTFVYCLRNTLFVLMFFFSSYDIMCILYSFVDVRVSVYFFLFFLTSLYFTPCVLFFSILFHFIFLLVLPPLLLFF